MSERDDLLSALGGARRLLIKTSQGLTDEQAGARSTISELCVGGLIKHVTLVESRWAGFMAEGTSALDQTDPQVWADAFGMLAGDTLVALVAAYEAVGKRTEEVVRSLPDLDVDYPLPDRPWFPPGSRWSARRAIVHLVSETSQHAGHADIIRESIDGQKSMG